LECIPACDLASEHVVDPGLDRDDRVNPVTSVTGLPPLVGDLERVEVKLRHAVASEDPLLADLASHLVDAGGKRIRPTMTLSAAYVVAGADSPPEDVVTGATACELVHLGSLHHDDVIDEATTRRGVPSVNARWSNIVAILSGDFLLARASSLASSLGADVAALLARTIAELCRGQVLELSHLFDVTRDEENYYSAIDGKTASLFATSCRVGGMASGANDATLDALERFGRHVGMCFQIVDDCLDVTGTGDALGKTPGQDLLEGIYTLPVVYALRESPELRTRLARPLSTEAMEEARTTVVASGAVESAIGVARDHAAKAAEALRGAEAFDASVCDVLAAYADGLVGRSS